MKTVDFSETIAASGLKVGRSRYLIEFIKVCEYCRSMSFLDLGHFLTLAQGHLNLKIKTCFSQIPLGHFEPNFVCKLSGTGK